MAPIRMLHCADIHLGVETYGTIDPVTGLNTRLLDFLATLDEAVETALREQVDVFLFAGDAYKSRSPNPTHQREFARRIYRLASAGIQVFLLVGNHDLPNAFPRATSLEIFGVLQVPNVHVSGVRPEVYRLQTRHGPLNVVALPWVTRSAMLAQDQFKNKSVAQLNEELVRAIGQAIRDLAGTLDPTVPAVLAGHCHVFGARRGTEGLFAMGQDPLINLSDLALPRFEYVALGHIHSHQVLHQHPPVVYSGSLNAVDFGEEGEQKGFVLVEVEPGNTTYRFVPVAARQFHTIEVKVAGADVTDEVRRAIERQADQIRGSIVRLQVDLEVEQAGLLREEEVRKHLRTYRPAYIAGIHKQIRSRGHTAAMPALFTEAMKPIDALRLYFESTQVPKDRQEALLERASRLLGADSPS